MSEERDKYTVHSSQYTVHGTQYTVYGSQFTVHSTQITVHRLQYKAKAHIRSDEAGRPKNRWAVYRLQFSDFRKPLAARRSRLAVYQNPVISKSTQAWISKVSTTQSVGSTSSPRIDLRMDAIIGI